MRELPPADVARRKAGGGQAITRTLQVGAEKFNNLFFYGPRSAGKSCAIDPVTYMFGAKLTDTRPEGQHVAAPMPRNVNSEDVTWSAKGMPFFISGYAERHDGGQVSLFLLSAQSQ